MTAFKEINDILDQIEDTETIDDVITEQLRELEYDTLFSKVPISVINALGFLINSYVNINEMLKSLVFEDCDNQEEIRHKTIILNNLFKTQNVNKLNVDKHILTQYYLMLCLLVVLSKDKFNDVLLAYMNEIEQQKNENEYLKCAEFSKHFYGISQKIIDFHEKKFTKPIYSRIVNSDENDYLYLWLTTDKKDN